MVYSDCVGNSARIYRHGCNHSLAGIKEGVVVAKTNPPNVRRGHERRNFPRLLFTKLKAKANSWGKWEKRFIVENVAALIAARKDLVNISI